MLGVAGGTGRGSFAWLGRLVLCAGLLVSSVPVHAQERADADIEAEYQQVVNAALTEYERGSWEESAALFQRAHQLRPSARTLRGLGLASYEARRYPESIRYLSGALEDARRPLTPKQREEVDATLTRARLFVGYLQLAIEPAQAVVTINGQQVQPDAKGVVITNIGWLEIEVSAAGYQTVSKHIRVNTGEQQTLALHMTREPSPEIAAAPLADPVPTPAAEPAVSPVLQPSALSDPGTSSHPYGAWKWVAAGGALVGVGVGATFLVLQKTGASSYQTQCVNTAQPPSDCEDRKSLLRGTYWTGSIVGLSVGAGLAALSVVLFALDGSSLQSEHASRWSCTVQACQLRF